MNLIYRQETGHTTNDYLINFIFVEKIWLFPNDLLYKILHPFDQFLIKHNLFRQFLNPIKNMFIKPPPNNGIIIPNRISLNIFLLTFNKIITSLILPYFFNNYSFL